MAGRSCWFGALWLIALAACEGEREPAPTIFGGDRSTQLRVPSDYSGEPAPLVLVLHAYGINGAAELVYARLDKLVDTAGALVLAPDGTSDAFGNLYWNTQHVGCDVGAGTERPDDAAYLLSLVDDVSAEYNVDAKRVFVFGHSNGGFMAYRLACNHAERFAAIISLAGAPALDASDCAPNEPVSVLQIHGDADTSVSYHGGDEIVGASCHYPGAIETTSRWAAFDDCTGARADTGERLNLDTGITGDETVVERYSNCAGSGVELWTIPGGDHIPLFPNDVHLALWSFFDAHAR